MRFQKVCQQAMGVIRCDRSMSADSTDLPAMKDTSPVAPESSPVQQRPPLLGTSTVPTLAPQAELQPISKASGFQRAPPQYAGVHSTSNGLGQALMAHAAATGGNVGVKSVKAKKLDLDFDFDEAAQEANAYSSPGTCHHLQS